MSTEYKNFGDFLNQKRLEKKISYREMAKVLDVSAPYISDIEKGRRNAPSIEKLEILANYFTLTESEKALMFRIFSI